MGAKYLIDSNILIEFYGDLLPVESKDRLSIILDEEFNISIITAIEVLGHSSADQTLENFLNIAVRHDLNQNVIDKVIELRRKFKIKIPDAIIAATSMTNNMILLTRNITDFKQITGIQIENPWEW